MKNMNILIIIAVAVVILILISVFKSGGEENIKEKWNTLLKSNTVAAEIKNIKILTEFISSKDGYWEVIGLQKDNTPIHIASYTGNIDNIQNIEVTFYWDNKKFKGLKWVPLEKKNIYEFFKGE